MSQENVELLRRGVEAWNRRELDVWLDLGTPDVEWMPAGPAAVEVAAETVAVVVADKPLTEPAL